MGSSPDRTSPPSLSACAFGLDDSSFSESRYFLLNLGITTPSSPVLEEDASVTGGESFVNCEVLVTDEVGGGNPIQWSPASPTVPEIRPLASLAGPSNLVNTTGNVGMSGVCGQMRGLSHGKGRGHQGRRALTVLQSGVPETPRMMFPAF